MHWFKFSVFANLLFHAINVKLIFSIIVCYGFCFIIFVKLNTLLNKWRNPRKFAINDWIQIMSFLGK